MKAQTIMLATITCILVMSCGGFTAKERYIHRFETFVQEVEQQTQTSSNPPIDEWGDKFKQLREEYVRFEDDLTDLEKKYLDNLTGRYYALLVKFKVNEVSGKFEQLYNQAEGFIEELKE